MNIIHKSIARANGNEPHHFVVSKFKHSQLVKTPDLTLTFLYYSTFGVLNHVGVSRIHEKIISRAYSFLLTENPESRSILNAPKAANYRAMVDAIGGEEERGARETWDFQCNGWMGEVLFSRSDAIPGCLSQRTGSGMNQLLTLLSALSGARSIPDEIGML
ncbi:hypothetical protein NPIL_685011 [Nephila pilipes]|uniref:Uncharacterized protein n=1 Tax=Nephila pilipes TaxID=299642 RepID=A0A8X6TZ58_NEPPI|nr:hypothetical protein NPIL_685011 [Nephila pilipes]